MPYDAVSKGEKIQNRNPCLPNSFMVKACLPACYFILLTIPVLLTSTCTGKKEPVRQTVPLNENWKTIANDSNIKTFDGFESIFYNDSAWQTVDIPHNWDKYHGYLRKIHGNRHGYAWYRKTFSVQRAPGNRRYFLFFEGVGSYATVWVNGKKAGYHAGGRTTFTLDITDAIVLDRPNVLAVRADHPANIRDLAWVCGGCSDEWGFSEGSQPMGIFRPVTLVITNDLRIEPFGVHVWNDTTISEKKALVHVNTEIKNYGKLSRNITLVSALKDKSGKKVAEAITRQVIEAGSIITITENLSEIKNPVLWSPENPCLYILESKVLEGSRILDEIETKYGIRKISWPINRSDSSKQFLINGKACFINGIGEYEHLFGNSHAFSDEQIRARVGQVKAAGFNAFRDAHQPHNLRYQEYWDKEGILWWTQFSAHIWFDNQEFRENFKTLLRQWVKERRNNPGNMMWGLQNESTLPYEFARECVEIIRELDPTSPSQRPVTTCNGGTGTDWNVVQNWSGTYGGDPEKYDEEISHQLLNGEYGAWRSIDWHSEGIFDQKGVLSEDRMVQLLELKIRKAESVRNQCCGQFLWLLNSHDNPGRIQNGEGLRDIDRIGPVNYKGLFTSWGEPLDAFYMYRANYVPAEKEPMVYIVSHTWPNRWMTPGKKDRITVYSNCDEVELFNDAGAVSLGKRNKRGIGLPFEWEDVNIKYNVLMAKGYVQGNEAAKDMIILEFLPESHHFSELTEKTEVLTNGKKGYNYLYRLNCGGPEYTDAHGNSWMADMHQAHNSTYGSRSWTNHFEGIPAFYGSQRRTFDPIEGTKDRKLFSTVRYGLDELSFNFKVADGEYLVELYFCEPWYGTGGGMNCKGWRLFDVAVNEETVIKNFDIWEEAGHDKAVKKEFTVNVKGENLKIHFPKTASGQAIISAIAIASKDNPVKPATSANELFGDLTVYPSSEKKYWREETWLDIGEKPFTDKDTRFFEIPSLLFGAGYLQTPSIIRNEGDKAASFRVKQNSDVFISLPFHVSSVPQWMKGYRLTTFTLKTDDGSVCWIYSKRFDRNDQVILGPLNNTGNLPGSYSVFIIPESLLDTPSDQRPAKEYSSHAATLKGKNAIKKVLKNREVIEFTGNSAEEIEWKFSVGLAGIYRIHFNYMNNKQTPVVVKMILKTADGIVMHRETLTLKSNSENWQTLKTFTGTTINAGDYRVTLRIRNVSGLYLGQMVVQ